MLLMDCVGSMDGVYTYARENLFKGSKFGHANNKKMQLDVDVSPPANIIKIKYQYHMIANLCMGTFAMVHNIFWQVTFWSSLNFGQVTTDVHTESDA